MFRSWLPTPAAPVFNLSDTPCGLRTRPKATRQRGNKATWVNQQAGSLRDLQRQPTSLIQLTNPRRGKVAAAVLAALLMLCAPCGAQTTPERAGVKASVQKQIDAQIQKLPKRVTAGVLAVDVDTGEVWYSHQPDELLKPASVLKLFVTSAALERFGPDFRLETKVYLHEDELIVLGGGDPSLGDDRMAEREGRPPHGEFDDWATLLKARGVSTLSAIALDDSIFDREWRNAGWPDNQADTWYQAPVGGLNFNDNCLDASFTASGGKVVLSLSPELPSVFVTNKLVAAANHNPLAARRLGDDVFEFRGPVSRGDSFKPISVNRPTVFLGHALQQALANRGIELNGAVVRRELTPALLEQSELLDVRGANLRDLIWRTNTFSQNLFAECLLKSLAAYRPDGSRSGSPGSWNDGAAVMRKELLKLNVDAESALFRDGSGLSHDNRVSARQIVEVLRAMRNHRHRDAFLASLAEPGKPGSMRRRYDLPTLRGRMLGKTGSISGVRALAGYIDRADGRTLAFAVLGNGDPPAELTVRVAEILAGG